MRRHLLLVFLSCLFGCGSESSPPSPRAVLVVSSNDYSPSQVMRSIDSLRGSLGPKIDKAADTVDVGGKAIRRFAQYQIAYWYPFAGSDFYGVAVVKWVSDLKGKGADEMRDRYFIEVYARDESCELCNSVKSALAEHQISYFSACDHPGARSEYERIRCGT